MYTNGTIRKIFTKLESLCLQKYYFETGILFMNIMLRSSILYGCESYYNLKENEIRQLERIEEHFMRMLLKTKKKDVQLIKFIVNWARSQQDLTSIRSRCFFSSIFWVNQKQALYPRWFNFN